MTVGTVLAMALLGVALLASVAVAPIWRRSRPGAIRMDRLAAIASRAWRDRRAARWGPAVSALVCGVAGLAAGLVVAGVLTAYGAAGFVLVRGIAVRHSERRAYRLAADAVVGLAADLRAGAALAPAWRTAEEALRGAQAAVLPRWRPVRRAGTGEKWGGASMWGGADVAVVGHRMVAATALAQACGAPLADVLDRLDTHLRAVDRARAVADSQAAGARVSAGLLAAMPVAGVGLGVVVGVDAAEVLLHTQLGALAVGLALALQFGGLAWAARLAAHVVSP
jgi:tight adherence protein B